MINKVNTRYFIDRIRPRGYAPCTYNPVNFNCDECYAGLSPCRLKTDKALRFLRSSNLSDLMIKYSLEDENLIFKEIIKLLRRTYPASISIDRIYGFVKHLFNNLTQESLRKLMLNSDYFFELSNKMFVLNTNVKFDSFSNKIENNFYQDYYTSYIINSRSDWENTINDFKEYKSILLIEELLEKVYKYINSLNPDFRPDGDLLDITNIERFFDISEDIKEIDISFDEYNTIEEKINFIREIIYTSIDEEMKNLDEKIKIEVGLNLKYLNDLTFGRVQINPENYNDSQFELISDYCDLIRAIDSLSKYSFENLVDRKKQLLNNIILNNLKLVRTFSSRVYNPSFHLNFDDLFQIGILGLMQALDKFNPYKGYRFSTYASFWIRQRVMREISDLGKIIRIPVHLDEEIKKIIRTSKNESLSMTLESHNFYHDNYLSFDNDDLNLEQVASICKLSPDKIKEILIYNRSVISLNSLSSNSLVFLDSLPPNHIEDFELENLYDRVNENIAEYENDYQEINDEENIDLNNIDKLNHNEIMENYFPINQDSEINPHEISYKQDRTVRIEVVLETLSEREAGVLRLRFGLGDGRSRTLEDVGKDFGVTRERIRQIEAKALRKLRHPMRSKELRDFLYE